MTRIVLQVQYGICKDLCLCWCMKPVTVTISNIGYGLSVVGEQAQAAKN